jgi:hypothetical protein
MAPPPRRSLCALLAALACACSDKARALRPPPDGGSVTVLARAAQIATYPCMERCHARRTPDPTPRAMREFHTGRVLNHGPTIRACSFCHDSADLDHLQLITGERVSFDEAYRVCGQCHGEKLRDWDRGIHGAQSGSWAGERLRRSCPACHDPHTPQRPMFDPLPPPAHDRAHPPGASHS